MANCKMETYTLQAFRGQQMNNKIYIRLQMRILKTRSLFLILENIIVFFLFNFWLQRIV